MADGSICDHCGENDSDHLQITIFNTGSKVQYTIPSFPVFTVGLTEIKLQFLPEEGGQNNVMDGYAKNSPKLYRPLPSLAKVCAGNKNGFFIDYEEFERSSISLIDKKLYMGKVFVLWKWEWEDCPSADSSTSGGDEQSLDGSEGGDEECSNDIGIDNDSSVKHSVVFKCVGVTKTLQSQELLAEVSRKIRKQEIVPVRLRPEPNNPKDSRALLFECDLVTENNWQPFGYVVREALDSVHLALQREEIVSVEFAWVRYITHWSSSGPGWYCGITVTKEGLWPKEVVRCSSTIQ